MKYCKPFYKPSEFAKMIGVCYKTLNNWDKKGILVASRTLTNRKYYTDEHLKKIKESGENNNGRKQSEA